MVTTFSISCARGLKWLFTGLGLGPRYSKVSIADTFVTVRMGWAFAATFSASNIERAVSDDRRVGGWGAHGYGGRWLVNGSSMGLVSVTLREPVRAKVSGFTVSLRELRVSLEDPEGFLAAVNPPSAPHQ